MSSACCRVPSLLRRSYMRYPSLFALARTAPFRIYKLILVHIVAPMFHLNKITGEFFGTYPDSIFFFLGKDFYMHGAYFTALFISTLFSCLFNKLHKKCFFIIPVVLLLLNISGDLFLRPQSLVVFPCRIAFDLFYRHLYSFFNLIFDFFLS